MTEQIEIVIELVLPFLSCVDRQIIMTCVRLHSLVASVPTLICNLRRNGIRSRLGSCAACKNHYLRFRRVKQIVRLIQGFVYDNMQLPRGKGKEQEEDVCEWNAARMLAKSRKFPSWRQVRDMAKRLNTILDAGGKSREIMKKEICSLQLIVLFSSFLTNAIGATLEYSIRSKYEVKRCLQRAVAIYTYLFEA